MSKYSSNNRIEATPKSGALYGKRVCRAWHRTSQVQVLTPGVRKAEG